MFPEMLNDSVTSVIERHGGQALGWKLSGAGGGGYVIFVAQAPIPNAVRVRVRRQLD